MAENENGGGGGVGNWVKTHKTEAFVIAGVGIAAIIIIKNQFFSSGSSSTPAANTSNATIGANTGNGTPSAPTGTTGAASNNGGGSSTTDPQLNADLSALTAAVDSLISSGATQPAPSSLSYNYSSTTTNNSTTNNVTNNNTSSTPSSKPTITTTKASTAGAPSSSALEAAGASTIPGAHFSASAPPPPLTTKGYTAPLGSSLLSNNGTLPGRGVPASHVAAHTPKPYGTHGPFKAQ